MDREALRRLLSSVRAGRLPVERALERLAALPPTGDLGFARVDHHRALRQGHPEVVYAPGKTPAQLAAIAKEIARRSGRVLVTRVDDAQARAVRRAVKGSVQSFTSVALLPKRRAKRRGIVIVTAGTSDLPVAEEARLTCRMMGCEPELVVDVGVAGIHRLFAHAETLRAARVLIVAAGMEGALPSVVGGLVAAPVIAVPTSVGYGTGAGGFAALLAMLNSCAANVCCVNIDDGFGAGTLAGLICLGSGERGS
ncbi:MAG: nickel pincer cofactor biosynthesis protein LarB [Planctomycetaceae bacterium]